jgi:hypothetical protein
MFMADILGRAQKKTALYNRNRLDTSPFVSGPGASSAQVFGFGLNLHHPTPCWFRRLTYPLVTSRMFLFCMAETTIGVKPRDKSAFIRFGNAAKSNKWERIVF